MSKDLKNRVEMITETLEEELFNSDQYPRLISLIDDSADHKQLEAELCKFKMAVEKKLAEHAVRLEATNEELKKLDQLKSDFVSTVSHELKTPLAIVKEGISLILDKTAGPINKDQKKILATSKSSIDRLARLIEDLLDISKIEEGKIVLKKESVDISEVIDEVSYLFTSSIKAKGLKLKVSRPKKKICVYADMDRLMQIFINLLSNALKFTESGFVEFSVREDGEDVICSVTDSGVGIADHDLPRVFSKFQQFGRIPGNGEKGTGLGLSITKNLIELHNGNISVESTLEKGTKFTFNLPKYNPKRLFSEYVSKELKESTRLGLPLSLIMFKIRNWNKKMTTTTSGLADLVKKNLRRQPDTVIKDGGKMLVLLPQTKKEEMLAILPRIEQVFVNKKIDVTVKVASFPEDANSDAKFLGLVTPYFL